ncbi:UBX domain-containing protein 4 isoform X2 [Ostrinia furnacalis]|uniref:UBX domain-containing protein 4 isoform X1 n=1 Tax=Ostrinia furnacalis TaxID=93504 RepID=UPI00104063C5|nr:UBX domain-containing protein 4 isoform X1 [Ostrinia furnacalis]XP_028156702.1 UBX domain-containing protein 4 isoform X2 [Ostrinia furnacalis]
MHWYGGSIAEAVTLSKQKNAIFVVFVEGENDLSAEMSATIDDSAVVKRLSDQTNFLAIKLKSGTTNYTHFAQIYQFVPVPSLFFIGRNGTPLEVVCAGVQPSNLATRIDRILEEHHNEKQPSMQPSTSAQNVREQTSSLLQAEAAASAAPEPKPAPEEQPETSSGPAAKIQKTEHHEVSKSGQEYDVVCDGDVCVRRPRAAGAEPGPSQRPEPVSAASQMETEPTAEDSTASMEEKLERAKELIEARRREKAQKEKELEKQKELERRSQGQGMTELKNWQAEQELRQIQEERKREKFENNLARQRILEQIAQDRAERRARDQAPRAPPAPPAQSGATSGDGSGRARVQFKLPDGRSHTAHFAADDTLATLQQHIADNLQMSASNFSLWTAFPRRELSDPSATLRQLELAPSAALLVLPRRAPTQVAAPSPVASIVAIFTQFITSFILAPSQQLFNWIRARLFAPPPPTTPSQPPRASPPPGLRRRGNIHRLPGERAADDDNNTWNGNSTQQM